MKFNVLAMEAVFQLHICNVAISFYPCSIPNPTQLKDHGCSFFMKYNVLAREAVIQCIVHATTQTQWFYQMK